MPRLLGVLNATSRRLVENLVVGTTGALIEQLLWRRIDIGMQYGRS